MKPAAPQPEPQGLITIEVVDNPTFWDYAGDYVYVGLILLFVGVFFWRKWAMRDK